MVPNTNDAMCVTDDTFGSRHISSVIAMNMMTDGLRHHEESNVGVRRPIVANIILEKPMAGTGESRYDPEAIIHARIISLADHLRKIYHTERQ